jgi:hypothetical protein
MAVGLPICAQQLSQQVISLDQRYRRAKEARNYREAERALNKLLAMREVSKNSEVKQAVLYNRACVSALQGLKSQGLADLRAAVAAGLLNYSLFAHDHDLDSLRDNREFKLLLKEIKIRSHLNPLSWVRSSQEPPYQLTFDPPEDPRLAEMRQEFHIDEAIADAASDYERLVKLTVWVSRQWAHSNTEMASSTDPRVILREGHKGGKFICTDYAIVTAAVARAYGFYARQVALLPYDIEKRTSAHQVAEIWLPQFSKWVLADGQYGIVGESNGKPLNGVELQAALASDARVTCLGNSGACDEWKDFILPNLFYFKIAADQRRFDSTGTSQLVLVPKGAPQPHKVNGGNENVFAGARYTSDPAVFYQSPVR